jgi:hypothetical protein
MNGLTVDRSGRTLEDYRELYWQKKAQAKELEATLADFKESNRILRLDRDLLKAVKALLEPDGICGHGSG